MANLDIHVSEEEMLTFTTENRPVWPRIPTPCPVTTCSNQPFITFRDFINHWKRYHDSNKAVLVCLCGKKFAIRKHLNTHLKQFKSHKEGESKMMQNLNYIDPGTTVPYQYGSPSDKKDMKDLQKFEAGKRRLEEANKFSNIRDLVSRCSTKSVCWDEVVKERDGKIVKDTNKWDSPRKRRRLIFE